MTDRDPNVAAVRAATGQVSVLVTAAESNKLVLDPAVADELHKGLTDHAAAVGDLITSIKQNSGPLPLGNNFVGQAMSGKFGSRSDGGDQSLAHVLGQYQQALEEAAAIMAQCSAAYSSAEDDVQHSLHNVGSVRAI